MKRISAYEEVKSTEVPKVDKLKEELKKMTQKYYELETHQEDLILLKTREL